MSNLPGAKVYFDGGHWIAIPHVERPCNERHTYSVLSGDEIEQVKKFDEAFKNNLNGKRSQRKAQLMEYFMPLFDSPEKASQFVEKHFERLSRNRWERYKRMIRRAHLQRWSYFCTFTYDDAKHTEESFRKQLMNCLYHLSNRKGWRYIGAWEKGDLGDRTHFHALVYIPDGQDVGKLEEHNDYSTKRHRMVKTTQYDFFNKRFGRSDFNHISNQVEVNSSVSYMLKYITKNNEKIIYSRGLKTYLICDIIDADIICPMGDIEHGFKYLLSDSFYCIEDGVVLGQISPEVIEQMPKSN